MEEKKLNEVENETVKADEPTATDDELIEDVDPLDDAPVDIIYRCKKCGQILTAGSKDCWKCSSKDIEEVVEEDTKELRKVLLQARISKLEDDVRRLKKNNDWLYIIIAILVIVMIIFVVKK